MIFTAKRSRSPVLAALNMNPVPCSRITAVASRFLVPGLTRRITATAAFPAVFQAHLRLRLSIAYDPLSCSSLARPERMLASYGIHSRHMRWPRRLLSGLASSGRWKKSWVASPPLRRCMCSTCSSLSVIGSMR